MKKDKNFWKTETKDEIRHPYRKNVTSPESERELTKTTRSCPTRKDPLRQIIQKGPTTSPFLREGGGREILGEWMKMTSVRSQDQRRMIQSTSHFFPSNTWIHKISKGKEPDKCDLCKPPLSSGGPIHDRKGSSHTRPRTHTTHFCILVTSPHHEMERINQKTNHST